VEIIARVKEEKKNNRIKGGPIHTQRVKKREMVFYVKGGMKLGEEERKPVFGGEGEERSQ